MSEKSMIIVDADVALKVDNNRGDMSRSDFINFMIDKSLNSDNNNHKYITEEEFNQFQQGTRELLKNFLEFFISYGLELGKQPEDQIFQELSQKLQAFGDKNKG